MLTVTKIFTFDSAHFLPDYEGQCEKLHGHTYKLEIEIGNIVTYEYQRIARKQDETMYIEGHNVNRQAYFPPNGMVVDFADIKKFVSPIIEKYDHTLLNDLIEMPTAENLVMLIKRDLHSTPIGTGLVRIRLWETPNSYAEWKKDTE